MCSLMAQFPPQLLGTDERMAFNASKVCAILFRDSLPDVPEILFRVQQPRMVESDALRKGRSHNGSHAEHT